MRRQLATLAVLLAPLILVGCGMAVDEVMPISQTAERSPILGQTVSGAQAVPNQFIVGLNEGVDPQAAATEIANRRNGNVLFVYETAFRGFALEVSAQAAEGIRQNPQVEFVEQDLRVQAHAQTLPVGIDYVTQNADTFEVANMSLGGQGQSNSMRTAIQNSVDAGVYYAVSAGNDASDVYGSDGSFGTSDDYIPAAYPEVATISAMAEFDGTSGGNAPAVDSLSLSEDNAGGSPHADFDVSWSVSDSDGDLNTVDLTLTDLNDGETEATATIDVSGSSASGTTDLKAKQEENSGHEYEVELVVTDSNGNTASSTATEVEDGS